jgi:hypothetical protein
VLRVVMARLSDGLIQDVHGMTHLPLDDAELFVDRGVFIAEQEVHAISAGFDSAERLPQIVRQACNKLFGFSSSE